MAIQEHSAGAVIFRNEPGKKLYLLLHYESGHWDFAKGHVEKGETIEQTIGRECEEETGIRDLEFIDGFSEKGANTSEILEYAKMTKAKVEGTLGDYI